MQTGAPLVGRGRELDRLADALASARAERRAQLLARLVQLPAFLLWLGRSPDFLAAVAGMPETPWLRAKLAVAAGDWQCAGATLETIGAAGDAAELRRTGAEVLLRSSRQAEAESLLTPALAFYESVGASARVLAARTLLAASA